MATKNKLTNQSHPLEWMDALLPLHKKKDEPACVSIEEWTTFTNLRAILANAGKVVYSAAGGIKPFTPNEIQNFIALYILQGLSPSPHVKQKFQRQFEDPVNGNDMVVSMFGKNAEKGHKIFITYFRVQDPRKIVPPKASRPNFKIDPFLKWVQTAAMSAWDLGNLISCDKQMIGFKGNNSVFLRVTYLKEGDGVLCDSICENGFTYSFFFEICQLRSNTLTLGFPSSC
jgi:hypothetical protein